MDLSVAILPTAVGWTVVKMVGAGFGIGVHSGSCVGQVKDIPDMCATMSLTRLA